LNNPINKLNNAPPFQANNRRQKGTLKLKVWQSFQASFGVFMSEQQ